MSAILHGGTIIFCSQEMWHFFIMNTVATNISAELLYVYVQCLVISLEYLKWDGIQTWRCHFLNWQFKLHLIYSRTMYCNSLYLHSVKCLQLQNALIFITLGLENLSASGMVTLYNQCADLRSMWVDLILFYLSMFIQFLCCLCM